MSGNPPDIVMDHTAQSNAVDLNCSWLEIRLTKSHFVDVAASTDGNRGFESVIQTGNDAGQKYTPTNPGNSSVVSINFRKTADQGVGTNGVSHSMVTAVFSLFSTDGKIFG